MTVTGLSRFEHAPSDVSRTSASTPDRESLFYRAAATAKTGLWVCDLKTNALTWTRPVYDMFGIPFGNLVRRAEAINHYDTQSRLELEDVRSRSIREGNPFHLNARIGTAAGDDRWIKISAQVECRGATPARLFGFKQDITAEIALLDTWRKRAECDAVTGLANRAKFESVFHGAPASGQAPSPVAALILADLDNFKSINDNFGHAAGDECLAETGRRLRHVFQDAPLVARIGGDEFAVIAGAAAGLTQIEAPVRAFLTSLRDPVTWNRRRIAVQTSLGIAIQDAQNPLPPAQLYIQADRALYAAKALGRNQYVIG